MLSSLFWSHWLCTVNAVLRSVFQTGKVRQFDELSEFYKCFRLQEYTRVLTVFFSFFVNCMSISPCHDGSAYQVRTFTSWTTTLTDQDEIKLKGHIRAPTLLYNVMEKSFCVNMWNCNSNYICVYVSDIVCIAEKFWSSFFSVLSEWGFSFAERGGSFEAAAPGPQGLSCDHPAEENCLPRWTLQILFLPLVVPYVFFFSHNLSLGKLNNSINTLNQFSYSVTVS